MNDENEHLFAELAVIGMSGHFPKAPTLSHFWENLSHGREMISFFSDEELRESGVSEALLNQSNYVKAKGIIEDAESFDADLFGYSPGEAETMDPQQRRLLECAWEALENAGYDPEQFDGKIGVFVGCNPSTYFLTKLHPELSESSNNEFEELALLMGNGHDYLATRLSYKLNLKGPSKTVQTACSTSLVCVHDACQSLLSYECDLALAGGVAISFPQKSGYLYSPGSINSPDGHCRSFDHKAAGTVFGDGAGLVVLKRLEDAINDGDTILAIVKGSAINNDGSDKVGFSAPSVQGQTDVIAAALAAADVEAHTISYVETHGTGTSLGDPIEIAALTQAFRMQTDDKQFCAIGSLKTNTGHLVTAAGIAGLIKTILMLHHKKIPPSLHFEIPNQKISFSSTPFFVNSKLVAWTNEKGPLRAGVSAFGIGGTNAHLILEEAPSPSTQQMSCSVNYLLPFSANDPKTLSQLIHNFIPYLKNSSAHLADLSQTLKVGRKKLSYRHSFVCTSKEDAILHLESFLRTNEDTSKVSSTSFTMSWYFSNDIDICPSTAKTIYANEKTFRSTIDNLAALIQKISGHQIKNLLLDSSSSTNTSPSLLLYARLALQYATAKLLISWDIKPDFLDGDGLGLIVTGVLANLFSLESALHMISVLSCDDKCEQDKMREIENFLKTLNLSIPTVPFSEKEASQASWWSAKLRASLNSPRPEDSKAGLPGANVIYFGSLRNSPSIGNRSLSTTIHSNTNDLEQALLTSIGQLWEAGLPLDWSKMFAGKPFKRVPLPTYPFARKKFSKVSLSVQAPKGSLSKQSLFQPMTFDRIGKIVAILWQDVLKIEHFKSQDNFFLLGGDSLSALEVIDLFKTLLSIEISLQDFFENPTIEQLAELIKTKVNNRV